MDVVLLVGVIGVPIAVLVALGFGISLIRKSRQHMAERQQSLRWAGVNLSEPAVNVFVVYGLLMAFSPHYVDLIDSARPDWHMLPRVLLATLPILILLKPLLGWTGADTPSRDLNRAMVGIGLLRWAVTAFSLIYPPAVLMGLLVLAISVMVIVSMADDIVNPKPVHGIAVGLGPEGVKVAPLGDFSRDDQPGITF